MIRIMRIIIKEIKKKQIYQHLVKVYYLQFFMVSEQDFVFYNFGASYLFFGAAFTILPLFIVFVGQYIFCMKKYRKPLIVDAEYQPLMVDI